MRARGLAGGGLAAGLVALVAFLPFARGLLLGRSFYFRDLSLYYFPVQRFFAEGLRQGELRYWNPYVHEGVQELFPPISYPLDLLHALAPHEAWFSVLLALHIPIAALSCFMLARGIEVSRLAAAGGALAYSLGGYALSALNLFDHLHALSWAPLVVLGLMRAARGGSRAVAVAALGVALVLSPGRMEVAAQTVAAGFVLGWQRGNRGQILRLGASVVLGAGLAAPTLISMGGLIAESARGAQGLAAEVVLSHSVHPFTFLQIVAANLYGDLGNVADRWWGQNFFPKGFPYILSLYLGVPVLCLAIAGARHGRTLRLRLVVLALVAAYVCLGRWGGLAPLVEALPVLRSFRYPTKAFFTVHLAVALLAALGLDALTTAVGRRAWKTISTSALGLGLVLAGLPILPWLLPGTARWFAAGFFVPGLPEVQRAAFLQLMLRDAATGGLIGCAAGSIALLVVLHRVPGRAAPLALVALVGVDLLRAGAGLNPMVTTRFFEVSPEMAQEVEQIRREGGRVFTCDPTVSPAYFEARRFLPGRHEAWTFATLMETLTPYFNVSLRIPTARSPDLTMLVPLERVPSLEESGCTALEGAVGHLRHASVAHVISIAPLSHPDLVLGALVSPARVAPLKIYVYRLRGALPERSIAASVTWVPRASDDQGTEGFRLEGGVAVEGQGEATERAHGTLHVLKETPGHLEAEVEVDRNTVVLYRQAYARGWAAWVDSIPRPVLKADGHYMAVQLPSGKSHVVLRYAPPRLRQGLALAGASLLALAILGARRTPSLGA